MDFYSAYAHGFARVAACTVPVSVADPAANAAAVLAEARACHDDGVAVAVFPELALSGYAIDDLFLQDTLLEGVLEAVEEIVAASADLRPVLVVGAPLVHGTRVLNCAVVIHAGTILGVAPKSYLPTYREFYERRHFAPGDDRRGSTIVLGGREVPFGPDLIFTATDVRGPGPARGDLRGHVGAGAAERRGGPGRRDRAGQPVGQPDHRLPRGGPPAAGPLGERALPGGVPLCGRGPGRVDHGPVLGRADAGLRDGRPARRDRAFPRGCAAQRRRRRPRPDPAGAAAAGDLRRQPADAGPWCRDGRCATSSTSGRGFRRVGFRVSPPAGDIGLRRKVDRFPFVPDDAERLALDCYEAYNIQVSGLEQRLHAIGHPKVVIGVSGGLDSTHALIVAARAMDRLGRPRSDIHAFTMPGFATGETTKSYATRLSKALGVTFEELDIIPAARQMLADLDHPFADGEPVYDVTFENVQAGLRTDYLFRLANHRGGIVLGTGDLSELALGWCTYGVGDQMSHYAVNTGVPKTLIQHLIRWVIDSGQFQDDTNEVLREILDQEITPELIPTEEGKKPQATEDSVGPYSLQDFTLFHVLRHGTRPSKVAFLAWHAWRDAEAGEWPPGFPTERRAAYDLATVRRWLEVFVRRFFTSQFKRSALPNGPKVSAGGSLSPRGDWRMPSDASGAAWLAEIERNVPKD